MYLAFGIVFLVLLLALAAGIVVTLVRSLKEKDEVISKKNLLYLVPVFLIVYFLHVTASAFNGKKLDFFYCYSLINAVFDALKAKTINELLTPLCNAYPVYYVDFALAFLLGAAAAILSVASFFGHRLRNFFSVKSLLGGKCDVVLGDSDEAVKYAKNTKRCLLLGTDISRARYADLMKEGVTVLRARLDGEALGRKLKKTVCNVIVFRDGKLPYTKVIDAFSGLLAGGNAQMHLEANQDEMKILKEKFIPNAEKSASSHLACFSKYELMARRFTEEHPITKYIPRSFYNPNFTLKEGKEIHVVFVGFGKVNYQLFRMCAMQFQFAGEKNGKLLSHPVHYHIYDKENTAMHNEFFSRILFEFEEDYGACDFPKPEPICLIDRHQSDINSVEARKHFKSLVTPNSFTYFIVSVSEDLEDASYAQTLKRLMKNEKNYRIFVRAKNGNGEVLNDENDSLIFFGEDAKIYSHENIVNDELSELAKRINLLYNNIANPPDWVREVKKLPLEEQSAALQKLLSDADRHHYMETLWNELPYIEQASNLYHALNLPFKLHLLGFCMERGTGGVTEAEFRSRYINSGVKNDYRDYSFFFGTEPSNVLAYIEHSRWNALYILYDYKQMPKSEMRVVNGKLAHKDVARKLHACLTSYYGLHELIAFKFAKLYPDEDFSKVDYKNDARLAELAKIYAYDYMDLDKIYGEITSMGYVLKPIEE